MKSLERIAGALALTWALFLPPSAPAVQVRIASWNILQGLDTSSNSATNLASRNDDWWQVVDSIRRVDPDIVGFAELNNKDFSRLPELAAELDYPYYAISSEPMNSGEYRQGVMSKFEILTSSLVKENTVDPDAREIKRWPIHATIAVPGALNPLHVFVVHTHPGTAAKQNAILRAMNAWRMRQYLDRMAAELPDDVEYVVMGDFNEDAYSGDVKWDSFDYAYYTNRLAASRLATSQGKSGAPFDEWFNLGSDFPWSTNTAATIPYRPYPTDCFGAMAPLADTFRTGLEADLDRTTYPAVAGRTLDYILFSDEILQSAYGTPQCEVYWGTNDFADGSAGLTKPGPWRDTLHLGSTLTENKQGLDHLMVFGDFHMIDAVAGLTPVAIISEVVHRTDFNTGSYVEISNTGAGPLKIDDYSLEVYFNGSATNGLSVPLSGTIPAGGSVWIVSKPETATNHWSDVWDHAPDFAYYNLKNIDGDDAIVLKNASGHVIDVFGAIGIDGTGKPWEYTGQSATRVPGVTEPITVWSADEWTFAPYTNATPGRHESISEADASVSGLAFAPAAPAVGASFALSATVQPNALASNLAVSAHFSLNGGDWSAKHAMSNTAANVWTLDPVVLAPAPAAGDLLSAIVEVNFDGPGDLSSAFSSQHDYVFPGLTDGTGKLRTPLFNEVAPAAGFVELAGPANASLEGWSIEHWRAAEGDTAPLWTNVFAVGEVIPDAHAVSDEWGNSVGFAVFATNAFETNAPAALVLRNPQGAVADAIAWLPAEGGAAALAVAFLPGTVLSTNVAQGLANYLHVLGAAPSSSSNSLQAPDWVLAGRSTNALLNLTQWTNAAATSGAINSGQSSGALRLVRVDRDGDSLLDDEDNCPGDVNPAQADIDGDGLGNDCDDDMDGDGIPNGIDNCPYALNPEQEDFDNDGIGDACDDDFDSALLPATESFFVTFDAVTNGYNADWPSAFADGGRDWTFTNAAAYGFSGDRKIGARAARFRPGGILALDGTLTNGLSSVAFFAATRGETNASAVIHFETSTNGTNWTSFAAYDAANAPSLARVQFAGLTIPAGVQFRVRLDPAAPTNCVNLDNLRLVANVFANADADIVSDLVVTHDGNAHTNSFVVTPADAVWSVSYTNAAGTSTNAPVDIGTWSAVVTIADSATVRGGVFTFPGSLVIQEAVGAPEFSDPDSVASAVMAILGASVNPNRSSALDIRFDYGTTPQFGNRVLGTPAAVTGREPVRVEATIENLRPDTLYYWRVLAGDDASETQMFTTDSLDTPAPVVSSVKSNEFKAVWKPVEGATNYVLEVHTLAAAGEGQTIVENFSGWDYYYDYMALLGVRSSYHEQQTDAGTWATTNATVYNSGGASAPGSKGYVAISSGGWLQTPPLDNIAEVAMAIRANKSTSTLDLQVSEDGGATFAPVASYPLTKNAGWKTNSWAAALPADSILRFVNAGSRDVHVHDIRIVTSSASSTPVPGYPADLGAENASAVVSGLAPGTTYYLSVVAQGPGWSTEASEVVYVTTLAGEGETPSFARWLFTPSVAVDSTFATNVVASGSPAPVTWLNPSSAAGTASFAYDYDACTGINTVGILTYTPVAADIGTQTFTFVAQNEHGAVTNDFAVEVRAPATPAELYAAWLAGLELDSASYPADDDPDHDGATNWEEFIADTDPTNAASLFELSLGSASAVSNVVVWTFPASPSRFYQLVQSSNLVDFVTNSIARDPSTGTISITNSLFETLFTRIRVLLEDPAAP